MSQLIDQIPAAAGGLNYDDDPRFFEKGDTDYRLNVIPSALGDTYVLTNMKGTTKKSHSFTHDATYDGAVYTSLGACYDITRNAVYFFIYSDLTNHCILRYNVDDDDFDKIVWDNPNIGLDSDYEITDAFMIDNWLYWNPRSSSPRAINVEWAYYDYTQVLYSGDGFITISVGEVVVEQGKAYECIEETTDDAGDVTDRPDLFKFVSWCYADVTASSGVLNRFRPFFNTPFTPVFIPSIEVDSDTDYQYNNISGKSFQFAYRFHIPELGYSASSPYSEQFHFFTGERYDGEIIGEVTQGNLLNIHIPFYSDGVIVYPLEDVYDAVEILFREGDEGLWKIADSVPRGMVESNLSVYGGRFSLKVEFRNDQAYTIVDAAEVEKPFNYLPKYAESQWSLDGERVAYGRVTEGMNVPTQQVTLTAGTQEVDISEVASGTAVESIAITENVYSEIRDYLDGYRERFTYYEYYTETITLALGTTAPTAGDVVEIRVDGTPFNFTVEDGDITTAIDYTSFLVASLNSIPQMLDAWYVGTGPIAIADDLGREVSISISRYGTSAPSDYSSKFRSLKTGAWHKFCLFYYDDLLRRSEAVQIDPIYIPFPPELQGTIPKGTNYIRNIQFEIDHLPPAEASRYRFGYAGNASIGTFWQYNIAAADVVDDGDSEYNGLSYVDISGLQELREEAATGTKLALPNSTIPSYEFEQGDRIRFITKADADADSYDDIDIDVWTASDHDYEIVDFDPTTNYIYFNSDGVIGDTTSGSEIDYSDTSVIVEIYRRKLDADTSVYYEVGPTLNLYNDSGILRHRGLTQDQTSTLSANGSLTTGDVYLIARVFAVPPTGFTFAARTPVFVESYNISDFEEPSGWGKGKAGAFFGIGESVSNNVRYSNKYIKNARSSSVGVFDGLDYKTLSYNYGDITAIRQIGGVLKVVFENNVASVLVNRTQFYDADGQSQVVKSDNVLGSVNYSEESWGSVNPESVLVVDRNLYFFDLRRKAYVRNASNGSFPISDYKMAKYFIDQSDNLIDSNESNVSVYSAWDDDRGLVMVGINDSVDTTNSEIVLFHEASNRWVGFMSTRSLTQTDLIQIANDTLGTVPDFTIATNVDAGVYTSIVQVVNDTIGGATGTYNDNAAFNASDTITLQEGDSISLSFENVNGSFLGLTESIDVRIVGTGDIDSLTFSVSDYANTPYTNAITITETSTIQVSFAINGNFTIAADDFTTVDWSISITKNSVPILHGNSSGLFSFTDEDIWLHSDSVTYCNFWGTQQTYLARVYSVENPSIIKIFETMAVHGNERWDVTDIQIPASLNYPYGMQSKIPAARFEKEEGVLRSDYLCNMKSSSSTANIPDLLNGDNLRGYYLYHDLEGSETTKHVLYKVDVLSTPSKY